jgi:hypothetical protein
MRCYCPLGAAALDSAQNCFIPRRCRVRTPATSLGKSDEMQVKKCSTWTAASPSIQALSKRQASPCPRVVAAGKQHIRVYAHCNIFIASRRKIVGPGFLQRASEYASSLGVQSPTASRVRHVVPRRRLAGIQATRFETAGKPVQNRNATSERAFRRSGH